jgi:hypothetical protein
MLAEGFPHTPFQELKPPSGGEQSVAIAPSFPQPPTGESQAKEEVKAKPVNFDSRQTPKLENAPTVHRGRTASTYPIQNATARHFKKCVNPELNGYDHDPRFPSFRAELFVFWKGQNPDHPCPWIRPDWKALNSFLDSNTSVDLEGFKRMLINLARSDINPTNPPRLWLRNLIKYVDGPLDRYGKPLKQPRVL